MSETTSDKYYVSVDSKEDMAKAMDIMGAADEFSRPISGSRAQGFLTDDFSNLATNVSSRPGLTRDRYDAYRPSETVPKEDTAEIIKCCNQAYRRVGLIRNIIDLMGDFACRGIRLSHPNRRIEKFYRNWFARVDGKGRSERFLNNLYRLGNVVVRRRMSRLTTRTQERIYKSMAEVDISFEEFQSQARRVPSRYTFINPAVVHVIGGPLAAFVGDTHYGIKLPRKLRQAIQNLHRQASESKIDSIESQLFEKLPDEIKAAAQDPNKLWLIPSESVEVFHYKKDDWDDWAAPMIYAIMDDIFVLEKLKLADVAALDGAISKIRIYKLGSLEHKIMPTGLAAARLSEILESHVGGGVMDFVWGPDIELIESDTDVHQFLGREKYEPTLENIYSGLGIPPTLTGTFGAAGTTNNFISLQTLIQRLEYGRDKIREFWGKEIAMVQKAMGFRLPATLEFEYTNLGDVQAEKALWIDLWDRGVVSDELMHHRFGSSPELEKVRTNREQREREQNIRVQKASPYHDPQFDIALKKVALQSGSVTPSEVGLELKPRKKGEIPALKMRQPMGAGGPGRTPTKVKKQPGRPKNTPDKKPRKPKKFTPKTKAYETWATMAQADITAILNPGILAQYNKKNMRSLSASEQKVSEMLKFGVLCNLEPLVDISELTVQSAVSKTPPQEMLAEYQEWTSVIEGELKRTLTLDETRQIQACLYSLHKVEDDES